MAFKVVIADPLGEDGLVILRDDQEIEIDAFPSGISPADRARRLADAEGLIVRSATQVNADLLVAAPRLRVVVRAGAGTDNIDVEAATARGVVVMNTPGGNTNAAAEHTMALMLALARHIAQAARSLADGRWDRSKYMGWELRNKTLGLVGIGRIGSEVAARAKAFQMKVLGFDPFLAREAAVARGIEPVSVEDLLTRADVVSLHLPLSEETRHIIDAKALARMKRGSHLINCARGGLLDESAALDALETGQLAGLAVDVFESEPKPDARLVTHPRVVATPHLGASTIEAQAAVGIQAAEQIIAALHGTSFANAINLKQLGR